MSFGQGGYGGPGGPNAGQGRGFGPPNSGSGPAGGGHGPAGPAGGGPAPDWGALAAAAERERRRKRRLLTVVAGGVATVAIAGVVAAVVATSGGGDPSASASNDKISGAGDKTDKAEPSFSSVAPPPPPEDYIASEKKDTAPMSVGSFFPDKRITVSGHEYARNVTDHTGDCASGASTKLGKVLTANGCKELYRATYTRGGVAVTVGVAVFADEARAGRAAEQAAGNLQSLPGGGVPAFCRATACRLTSNTLGRYAYFTVAGYTSGKAVTAEDTPTRDAVRDTTAYVYRRILDRGKEQALADAGSQSPS